MEQMARCAQRGPAVGAKRLHFFSSRPLRLCGELSSFFSRVYQASAREARLVTVSADTEKVLEEKLVCLGAGGTPALPGCAAALFQRQARFIRLSARATLTTG